MNESDLQRVSIYKTYPRDSKIYSNRGFVNVDKGNMGGTHWCALYVKIISPITLPSSETNLMILYSIK